MVKPLQSLALPFFAIVLIALVGIVVATAPPVAAQGGVSPVTNIQVRNGTQPSQAVVSWDAVSRATHYRIGYVNMEVDYHLAKASCTQEWIEAFVYVDVNARNIPVNNGRAEYTIRRLSPGARHAFTVLTSNDFVDSGSGGSVSSEFFWPSPRWSFLPGRNTLPSSITLPTGECTDLTTSPGASDTPLTPAEMERRVRPALLQIVVDNSDGTYTLGTGFAVSSDGRVVTNRHVVGGQDTVTAYLRLLNGQRLEFTGRVLGRGILADLAMIRLQNSSTISALSLRDSDNLPAGTEVAAWGYPGARVGTEPVRTNGIISSRGTLDDTVYLQYTAATTGGSSGGPVVDTFGSVVAVHAGSLVRINDDGTRVPVPGAHLGIASNELSSRLNTLAAGGPTQATYRNLRYDYGYSMTIPKGWYVDEEWPAYTSFWPYTRKAVSYIDTYDLRPPSGARSAELDLLANYRWDRQLPEAAQDWVSFQKISKQKVTIAGQEFYRLEYRRKGTARNCLSHRVELVSVSSAYPGKPIGFVAGGGVCEAHLATHSGERDTMLNSFRP